MIADVTARRRFAKSLAVALLALLLPASIGSAQESPTHKAAPEITLRQIAPDQYFLFDYASSNASFLVTDEGVLVVDTRQHVRDGEDLIARIRKVTDKPIKWVVNSHFHADHYLGNRHSRRPARRSLHSVKPRC